MARMSTCAALYFLPDVFAPDMFHMGGDEVSERCWNSSEEIQHFMVQNRWDLDKESFLKLWNYFQTKAQDKAYKVTSPATNFIYAFAPNLCT